jgi:phage terminase large subunit-like protein
MTLDAITFIEQTLVDPESGENFVLTAAQKAFLRVAFVLTPAGRLKYPELVFSAPKKTGKTALSAMVVLYVVRVLGGRFAEGICAANDLEQAGARVFLAIARIVEASPMLAGDAVVTADKITFKSTGATIIAIASDAAGAAGANPTIVCFDELWGYTSERSRRLWDELVPPPTRKIACRLTTTYAGYEGESALLEDLWKRGLAGKEVKTDLFVQSGMAMYWTNKFTAPWQNEAWREQMRQQLRPNAYLRLIENRWVSTESNFVDMGWWDACTDAAATPLVADKSMPVWLGVDASVKRDSTAIVAVGWDKEAAKARLVFHRIFQPSATNPLDFEATIERTVRELCARFSVTGVHYDPYQMAAVAQRLSGSGVPMREYPQTVANLTAMGNNLYELVKGRGIVVYPDADIRLAMTRAIAIETSRGWRIAKEKTSHKIDVVVALAMAAMAAVDQGQFQPVLVGPIIIENPHPGGACFGDHDGSYGGGYIGGVDVGGGELHLSLPMDGRDSWGGRGP